MRAAKGYFVAADRLVDKRRAVIPAKPVQDRIGDAAGKPGIERDLDAAFVQLGKDLFRVRKGGEVLIVAIEGDHRIDKTSVNAVDELLVVFVRGSEFFQ